MCRHCQDLSDDKQVVHAFAEQAARRINEKWQKENTHASPITADDISIQVNVMQIRGSAHRILREMNS